MPIIEIGPRSEPPGAARRADSLTDQQRAHVIVTIFPPPPPEAGVRCGRVCYAARAARILPRGR